MTSHRAVARDEGDEICAAVLAVLRSLRAGQLRGELAAVEAPAPLDMRRGIVRPDLEAEERARRLDETVASICWCGASHCEVTRRQVLEGDTASCGRAGCIPPNVRHLHPAPAPARDIASRRAAGGRS